MSKGLPRGSNTKECACNVGDPGSIPGSGRALGEGSGYPLQYSCLENPWTGKPGGLQSMRSKELDMTKQVTLTFHHVSKMVEVLSIYLI